MPELPEVETVKNALKRLVLNKKILSVDVYHNNIIAYPSVEEFKEKLQNQTINDITRRGKWLIFALDDYFLVSHLRMEGKYFLKEKNEELIKHEHVVFKFNDNELRYHDTRKFGKMYLIDKDKLETSKPINELGLEPWDSNLTSSYLQEKYSNKNIPIKTILLDQSIITGIGNIYADEILFKSKLNPLAKPKDLKDNELNDIIKYTRETLEEAIKMGGTTIKSYQSENGVHGLFQTKLLVHSHAGEECLICGTEIIKIVVNGRGTYYCKKCQK
ncbi:MAG: DNA-formamidopyrimidine glycosylase [Firmicutes bacterium]|nr:DNA-formamidopyrimidine glycosylase [Bacillota bacterium]